MQKLTEEQSKQLALLLAQAKAINDAIRAITGTEEGEEGKPSPTGTDAPTDAPEEATEAPQEDEGTDTPEGEEDSPEEEAEQPGEVMGNPCQNGTPQEQPHDQPSEGNETEGEENGEDEGEEDEGNDTPEDAPEGEEEAPEEETEEEGTPPTAGEENGNNEAPSNGASQAPPQAPPAPPKIGKEATYDPITGMPSADCDEMPIDLCRALVAHAGKIPYVETEDTARLAKLASRSTHVIDREYSKAVLLAEEIRQYLALPPADYDAPLFGMRSGSLDDAVLPDLMSGYDRVFYRRDVISRPRAQVAILCDNSSSISSEVSDIRVMAMALTIALQGTAVDVDVYTYIFPSLIFDKGSTDYELTRIGSSDHNRTEGYSVMTAHCGTPQVAAMQTLRSIMTEHRPDAATRLLISITDGVPAEGLGYLAQQGKTEQGKEFRQKVIKTNSQYAYGYSYEGADYRLNEATHPMVQTLRSEGILTLGVGVRMADQYSRQSMSNQYGTGLSCAVKDAQQSGAYIAGFLRNVLDAFLSE